MRNQYLKDFRDQLGMRFAEDSTEMSYSDWIVKNTTLHRKPFTFDGYEFQTQIVDDVHPNMHVIKCSQVGATEVQMRKYAAFLTRHNGTNGLFTLPDDTMYRRVSQTRFKPMIDNDRVFNIGVERPIRSIGLYQINQSFAYFVGNKEGDATSIDADILLHDEVDLSDQEMLALFQSRLQGSEWRITQGFSTPTFEGFGIHAGFVNSDQHEYMCRCAKCGHHNIPKFSPDFIHYSGLSSDIDDFMEIDSDMFEKIELSKSYVMCEKCHHPLDLTDPSAREWVPRYPGRRSRGYRVTPFCTPRLGIDYILDQLIKYKQRDAIRRFHNTVLGEPYNDSNARLSELEIRNVMRGGMHPELASMNTPVFVGIDVGLTCHIVLYAPGTSERPTMFGWRTVIADNLVDEIEQLDHKYNIVGGAIDRHPYTPMSNEIRDLTGGRIMPVEYASSPTAVGVTLVKDELDNLSHVKTNRTQVIDSLVGDVRKRRVQFFGYGQHEQTIVNHLQDMVRIEKPDASAVWQKMNGDDHFFHAAGYAKFATRLTEAIEHKKGGEVRSQVYMGNLTVKMSDDDGLGVNSRRRHPTYLGVS